MVLQDFIIPAHPPTPFYLLASRLLSICANSATCERLFSVFGTTLTKLRNRMGTSTLTALAELKMHLRSEHQEKSTKTRMKHLFSCRSGGSSLSRTPSHTMPVSQPQPPDLDPGPTIAFSTLPVGSEILTSGLRSVIPNDTAEGEPEPTGTASPISLGDLFNFNDNSWINLFDGYARRHVTEELALCELLNQDAATEEGAEVDVDEMTEEILLY